MISAALTALNGPASLRVGPFHLWVHQRREGTRSADGDAFEASACWESEGSYLWLQRRYEVDMEELRRFRDELLGFLSGLRQSARLEGYQWLDLRLGHPESPRMRLNFEVPVGYGPGWSSHQTYAEVTIAEVLSAAEAIRRVIDSNEMPDAALPEATAPLRYTRHFLHKARTMGGPLFEDVPLDALDEDS